MHHGLLGKENKSCKNVTHGRLILGYRPKYGDFRSVKPRKEVTDLHELLYRSTEYFDEDIVFYFQKIIDLCEVNKLRLVLIKVPVSSTHYQKMQISQSTRQQKMC